MTDGSVSASVSKKVVETSEPTFKPDQNKIDVVLQPLPDEGPYIPPATPQPEIPPEFPVTLPPTVMDKRPVIIDIETTGLMPFDSTLISICAIDPTAPDDIKVFQDLDERQMVEDFLRWVDTQGFGLIVGYNVSFDYRFIFAKAMKFRLNAGRWTEIEISDMMQVMQQVKEAFVYGFNKTGHLYQWIEYLFNVNIKHTIDDILKAWKDKRYADIVDICKTDVNWTYNLWLLVNFTKVIPFG